MLKPLWERFTDFKDNKIFQQLFLKAVLNTKGMIDQELQEQVATFADACVYSHDGQLSGLAENALKRMCSTSIIAQYSLLSYYVSHGKWSSLVDLAKYSFIQEQSTDIITELIKKFHEGAIEVNVFNQLLESFKEYDHQIVSSIVSLVKQGHITNVRVKSNLLKMSIDCPEKWKNAVPMGLLFKSLPADQQEAYVAGLQRFVLTSPDQEILLALAQYSLNHEKNLNKAKFFTDRVSLNQLNQDSQKDYVNICLKLHTDVDNYKLPQVVKDFLQEKPNDCVIEEDNWLAYTLIKHEKNPSSLSIACIDELLNKAFGIKVIKEVHNFKTLRKSFKLIKNSFLYEMLLQEDEGDEGGYTEEQKIRLQWVDYMVNPCTEKLENIFKKLAQLPVSASSALIEYKDAAFEKLLTIYLDEGDAQADKLLDLCSSFGNKNALQAVAYTLLTRGYNERALATLAQGLLKADSMETLFLVDAIISRSYATERDTSFTEKVIEDLEEVYHQVKALNNKDAYQTIFTIIFENLKPLPDRVKLQEQLAKQNLQGLARLWCQARLSQVIDDQDLKVINFCESEAENEQLKEDIQEIVGLKGKLDEAPRIYKWCLDIVKVNVSTKNNPSCLFYRWLLTLVNRANQLCFRELSKLSIGCTLGQNTGQNQEKYIVQEKELFFYYTKVFKYLVDNRILAPSMVKVFLNYVKTFSRSTLLNKKLLKEIGGEPLQDLYKSLLEIEMVYKPSFSCETQELIEFAQQKLLLSQRLATNQFKSTEDIAPYIEMIDHHPNLVQEVADDMAYYYNTFPQFNRYGDVIFNKLLSKVKEKPIDLTKSIKQFFYKYIKNMKTCEKQVQALLSLLDCILEHDSKKYPSIEKVILKILNQDEQYLLTKEQKIQLLNKLADKGNGDACVLRAVLNYEDKRDAIQQYVPLIKEEYKKAVELGSFIGLVQLPRVCLPDKDNVTIDECFSRDEYKGNNLLQAHAKLYKLKILGDEKKDISAEVENVIESLLSVLNDLKNLGCVKKGAQQDSNALLYLKIGKLMFCDEHLRTPVEELLVDLEDKCVSKQLKFNIGIIKFLWLNTWWALISKVPYTNKQKIEQAQFELDHIFEHLNSLFADAPQVKGLKISSSVLDKYVETAYTLYELRNSNNNNSYITPNALKRLKKFFKLYQKHISQEIKNDYLPVFLDKA